MNAFHRLSAAFLCLFLLPLASLSGEAEETITLEYYGEIGCSHCDTFVAKTVPSLVSRYGIRIDARLFDILKPDVYEECGNRLSSMGSDFTTFPVLFVGNNAYQGRRMVNENLDQEIKHYLERGSFRPRVPESMLRSNPLSWSIISIAAAGIVDGVNPCAFTTLVFFISFLTLRGRSRKEILVTGLAFTFSVFVSYFAIGFGLLNALRSLTDTALLRTVLNIAITVSAAVFCILSLRDYILIRQGRADETALRLPGGIHRKIHQSIRESTGTGLITLGAMGAGFIVSVLELSCTGQLYLPTIAYMISTDSSPFGLRSLLVYNIGFILPLLAVFTAAYAGVGSAVLAKLVKKHLGKAKLALSGVFALLAVSIWVV